MTQLIWRGITSEVQLEFIQIFQVESCHLKPLLIELHTSAAYARSLECLLFGIYRECDAGCLSASDEFLMWKNSPSS